MPADSPFRRLEPAIQRVTVTVDGAPVAVGQGDNAAVALLLAGGPTGRSAPVSGAPRGPYCMMGVCFECLVEVDGEPNRRACMTEVRDGMRIRRQAGARTLEP